MEMVKTATVMEAWMPNIFVQTVRSKVAGEVATKVATKADHLRRAVEEMIPQ